MIDTDLVVETHRDFLVYYKDEIVERAEAKWGEGWMEALGEAADRPVTVIKNLFLGHGYDPRINLESLIRYALAVDIRLVAEFAPTEKADASDPPSPASQDEAPADAGSKTPPADGKENASQTSPEK